jgi:hypothetical protein
MDIIDVEQRSSIEDDLKSIESLQKGSEDVRNA